MFPKGKNGEEIRVRNGGREKGGEGGGRRRKREGEGANKLTYFSF